MEGEYKDREKSVRKKGSGQIDTKKETWGKNGKVENERSKRDNRKEMSGQIDR